MVNLESGFTLRIAPSETLLSTDDGQTFKLSDRAKQGVLVALSAEQSLDSVPGTHTAASAAMVAEARYARPTGMCERHPVGPARDAPVIVDDRSQSVSHSVVDALSSRTTSREFRRPSYDQLATLLFRSARTIDSKTHQGHTALHKPYPSAGGCHPVTLAIAAFDVADLEVGVWWFNSTRCELWRGDSSELARIENGLRDFVAGSPRIHAGVFAVADFRTTLTRYRAGGSLVWRDVGVALGYLHLCAWDLGLPSCIVSATGLMAIGDETVVDLGALVF